MTRDDLANEVIELVLNGDGDAKFVARMLSSILKPINSKGFKITYLAKKVVKGICYGGIHQRELSAIFKNELVPINIDKFAKWGYPHQQSTEEECW